MSWRNVRLMPLPNLFCAPRRWIMLNGIRRITHRNLNNNLVQELNYHLWLLTAVNDGRRIRTSSQDSSRKFFACIFANGETLSAFKVVWIPLLFHVSTHSLSKTFCFEAALEANMAIMQKKIIEWSESHIRFNALCNWMAEWKTPRSLELLHSN